MEIVCISNKYIQYKVKSSNDRRWSGYYISSFKIMIHFLMKFKEICSGVFFYGLFKLKIFIAISLFIYFSLMIRHLPQQKKKFKGKRTDNLLCWVNFQAPFNRLFNPKILLSCIPKKKKYKSYNQRHNNTQQHDNAKKFMRKRI